MKAQQEVDGDANGALLQYLPKGYPSECVPGAAGKDEKRTSQMKTWGAAFEAEEKQLKRHGSEKENLKNKCQKYQPPPKASPTKIQMTISGNSDYHLER